MAGHPTNKPPENPHINVCICTYKRPQMLSNLINKLQDQITDDRFTYSLIIVDNDDKQSAKDCAANWAIKSSIPIHYYCQPEQNIAKTRNMAVQHATGSHIAFIDDDEFPESEWLLNLLLTLRKYNCSGVLGPVKPFFEVEPPQWIVKSRICERPTYPTGTLLKNQNETRTGNVLLKRKLFEADQQPFNPAFGKTGGEDVDFFRRKLEAGFTFRWCNEAPVYEIVPPERFSKKFYIKRALLRGKVNAKRSNILSIDTGKSIVAVILYTLALPFCAIAGRHRFMKYLVKDCDHAGKLIGLFGIKAVKER